MIKIFNIDDEEVFSSDSESKLIEFTKLIAIENEDSDFSVLGVSDAKEYLLTFCPDLVLVENDATFELMIAFREVRRHFPSVAIVVFNKQGQWNYMDENFTSFNFGDKVNFEILDDASNSVYNKFGYPYVYQLDVE